MENLFVEILPEGRAYEGCKGLTDTIGEDDPDNLPEIVRWPSFVHCEKHSVSCQEAGLTDYPGVLIAVAPGLRYLDENGI